MGNEGSSASPSHVGYSPLNNAISLMIEQSKERDNNNPTYKKLKSTTGLYRSESTMDENAEDVITIGSYCYCDCDTYFVVITEILDTNTYKIIDLFEQRARISYTRNLKLIDNDSKLRIAQEQHKTYLLNVNRNS